MRIVIGFSCLALVAGCNVGAVDSSEFDPQRFLVALDSGKADESGLVELSFDEAAHRSRSGSTVDGFYLDVSEGDQFRLDLHVTWGSFEPEVQVHWLSPTSGTFEELPPGDSGTYTAIAETAHLVLVGSRFNTRGGYTITARCVGGPCSTEDEPSGPQSEPAALECLADAYACAIDRKVRPQAFVIDAGGMSINTDRIVEQCLASASRDCREVCRSPSSEVVSYACNSLKHEMRELALVSTPVSCLDWYLDCVDRCPDGEEAFGCLVTARQDCRAELLSRPSCSSIQLPSYCSPRESGFVCSADCATAIDRCRTECVRRHDRPYFPSDEELAPCIESCLLDAQLDSSALPASACLEPRP